MVKVSVCIPVYGVEKYIERCARSLFEQTMTDGIEFIFVNDCTKDNSIEILEKVLEEYPHRKEQVKIIHHEKNRGLVAARNTGLEHATGDYIIHCDSDDWVDPNMYEEMYNKAIETDADMVYCQIMSHGFKKQPHIGYQENIVSAKNYIISMLKCQSHTGLVLKLIKKSIAISSQIHIPDCICMHEDTLRTVQMAYQCKKVAFASNVYYHYQFNNTSISNSKWRRHDFESIKQTIEILEEKLLPKEDFAEALAGFKMEFLRCMIFHPEITNSAEFREYQKKYEMAKNIRFLASSGKLRLLLHVSLFSYHMAVFVTKCWKKYQH